jgi:amino-acid N-acetyltransferase
VLRACRKGTAEPDRDEDGPMSDVVIAPAEAADLDVIAAFLEREHLPLAGLHDHPQHMFVARTGNRIVGCASLELYGDSALLRSVAVDAEYRGSGIGADLTHAALHLAERRAVSTVYLLTTTAERFFPRFGFEMVDRADVPPAVRMSAEFAQACPSSAFVMRKFVTSPT